MSFYLFLLFICSFFIWFLKMCQKPKNYPPGPRWLPIVENSYLVRKLSTSLGGQYLAFQHLSNKYNTNILGLKLNGSLLVYIRGYKLIREGFTTEEFEGRPDNFFLRLRCFGKRQGLTFVDGPLWRQQKNFVVKHLKFAGYGKDRMKELIANEIRSILNILENNKEEEIDLVATFSPSVLNILWIMTSSYSISRDDPRFQNFLQVADKRSKAFQLIDNNLNLMPWLRFIIPELTGYNMIVRFNEELKKFFTEVIADHVNTWYPERKDDVIYAFITEMKNTKEAFTDEQLMVICLDIFFGGLTVTSYALGFLFIEMVLNPEIQEKAAESINSIIPQDQPLTYEDRLKLPFIEAIIMESARRHTIVSLVGPRRSLENIVFDGYDIPKDSSIVLDVHSVHYDPEYWKDPNVFRPERFINDEGEFSPSERVLTFGLGRRKCIGEKLAKECIFLFFASIVRKYKICPVPNGPLPSIIPVSGLVLSPQKFHVIAKPRNKNI